MSFIKIENGAVKVIDEQVLEAYSLEQFLEKLKDRQGIDGQFIPPGCVYSATAKTGKQFIIKEFRPRCWAVQYQTKTMNSVPPFRHPLASNNTFSFRISYPWMYLVLVTFNNKRLDNLSLFFTKEPLRSPDCVIYSPFVTNMWHCGSIRNFCMGDMKTSADNLEDLVQQAADQYFLVIGNNDLDVSIPPAVVDEVNRRTSSIFSTEDGDHIIQQVSSCSSPTKDDLAVLKSFEVYEKMSQDDPEIGMKLKYQYQHKFGDWINGFIENFQ